MGYVVSMENGTGVRIPSGAVPAEVQPGQLMHVIVYVDHRNDVMGLVKGHVVGFEPEPLTITITRAENVAEIAAAVPEAGAVEAVPEPVEAPADPAPEAPAEPAPPSQMFAAWRKPA